MDHTIVSLDNQSSQNEHYFPEAVVDRLHIRQSSILLLDHKTVIVPAVSGEAFHETYLHMLVPKCSLLFPLRSLDLAHGLAISLPLSYR